MFWLACHNQTRILSCILILFKTFLYQNESLKPHIYHCIQACFSNLICLNKIYSSASRRFDIMPNASLNQRSYNNICTFLIRLFHKWTTWSQNLKFSHLYQPFHTSAHILHSPHIQIITRCNLFSPESGIWEACVHYHWMIITIYINRILHMDSHHPQFIL